MLTKHPQFSVEPADTVVKELDDAQFECVAVAETKPTITWRKDWNPVQVDSRTQILSDGSLKISNVQDEDEGEYQCVATVRSEDFALVSRIAKLKTAGKYLHCLFLSLFLPGVPAFRQFLLLFLIPASLCSRKRSLWYWTAVNGNQASLRD